MRLSNSKCCRVVKEIMKMINVNKDKNVKLKINNLFYLLF